MLRDHHRAAEADPLLDVAVRLGRLGERERPVDDGAQLAAPDALDAARR